MNKILKAARTRSGLVAAVASLAATSASAAVDVTAITGEFSEGGVAAAAVGAAVLVLLAGIKIFKYIRGSF